MNNEFQLSVGVETKPHEVLEFAIFPVFRILCPNCPILFSQHMHHDAQTAATVRSTCVEMLPAYPAEDFVVVTLRTLTQLAAHALVDIPEQVGRIYQLR